MTTQSDSASMMAIDDEWQTTNLARFGSRELRLARDLIDALLDSGLPDDFENDATTVMMNRQSGYVFLTNANAEVAVERAGRLESFYYSPYDGHEGTLDELREEFDSDTWNAEDIEWFQELCSDDSWMERRES
jgi:hypothetical protein